MVVVAEEGRSCASGAAADCFQLICPAFCSQHPPSPLPQTSNDALNHGLPSLTPYDLVTGRAVCRCSGTGPMVQLCRLVSSWISRKRVVLTIDPFFRLLSLAFFASRCCSVPTIALIHEALYRPSIFKELTETMWRYTEKAFLSSARAWQQGGQPVSPNISSPVSQLSDLTIVPPIFQLQSDPGKRYGEFQSNPLD